MSTGRLASNLVGSAESRSRRANLLYALLLGRTAGPAERAYWAGVLRTATVPDGGRRLVATSEFAARGEGDSDHLVALLYTSLLGREPGPAEIAYWTDTLGTGTGRATMAKRLMASPEGLRHTVRAIYGDLLARNPGPGELAYWTPLVKAYDERFLVRQVVASPEYYARSQED